MAEKLSQRSTTSTITGGFVHIILPDGGGGWDSFRISWTDFVQDIVDMFSDYMDTATYDPTAVGGDCFDSNNIVYDPTISGLTATDVKAAIDEVVASIGAAGTILIDTETGKNANFNIAYAANTKFYSINFRQTAGSPTVKVGTSAGADDICTDRAVASGTDRNVSVDVGFESATTLYFTISGGTLDITIEYRQTYI